MLDFLVDGGGDHHVLGLEQSPHDVEDGGLPHGRVVRVGGQRRVARHQEVQVRGGDEGCD